LQLGYVMSSVEARCIRPQITNFPRRQTPTFFQPSLAILQMHYTDYSLQWKLWHARYTPEPQKNHTVP